MMFSREVTLVRALAGVWRGRRGARAAPHRAAGLTLKPTARERESPPGTSRARVPSAVGVGWAGSSRARPHAARVAKRARSRCAAVAVGTSGLGTAAAAAARDRGDRAPRARGRESARRDGSAGYPGQLEFWRDPETGPRSCLAAAAAARGRPTHAARTKSCGDGESIQDAAPSRTRRALRARARATGDLARRIRARALPALLARGSGSAREGSKGSRAVARSAPTRSLSGLARRALGASVRDETGSAPGWRFRGDLTTVR